ncbi:hypothetical protein ACUN90_17240, partial [Escherichia sp. SP-MK2]
AGSFVIGTSRQDGFMHYRNVVCLLSDQSEEVLYPICLVLSGLLINWVNGANFCNSRSAESVIMWGMLDTGGGT